VPRVRTLDLLAKKPALLVSGAATLGLQLYLASCLAPMGGARALLRLQWCTSAARYEELVESLGPAGRTALWAHFEPDLCFLLAYGLFGAGLLARMDPARAGARALLPFLPIAAAAADLVETALHAVLLFNREAPDPRMVGQALAANALKWSLLLASLLSLVGLCFLRRVGAFAGGLGAASRRPKG